MEEFTKLFHVNAWKSIVEFIIFIRNIQIICPFYL